MQFSMDRSWINVICTSDEYENGLKESLEFAKKNALDSNEMCYCPCGNCLNERQLKVKEICNIPDFHYFFYYYSVNCFL